MNESEKAGGSIMRMRIAIIGAGLSGLLLASELAAYGDVRVFEKSRGVGGRMATRHAAPFDFDHGTQFFTARGAQFQAWLQPLRAQSRIAEWTGKVIALEAEQQPVDRDWREPHYVAVPHMNSLCKYLAERSSVTLNAEVRPLGPRAPDGWRLQDAAGNALGAFDWVISTAPPVQTARIFADRLSAKSALAQTQLLGCYTLMLGFNKPWDRDWIAAKVRNNALEWIAVNSSKPQRNHAVTSLVVHSRNEWAQQHIEDDPQTTQEYLLTQLAAIVGIESREADHIAMHRWRYALVANPQPVGAYVDEELHLAATGDWCSASRIEEVWTNAHLLAEKLRIALKTEGVPS